MPDASALGVTYSGGEAGRSFPFSFGRPPHWWPRWCPHSLSAALRLVALPHPNALSPFPASAVVLAHNTPGNTPTLRAVLVLSGRPQAIEMAMWRLRRLRTQHMVALRRKRVAPAAPIRILSAHLDPDVLVLRRADGSVVARFSSRGFVVEEAERSAWRDYGRAAEGPSPRHAPSGRRHPPASRPRSVPWPPRPPS